MQGISKRNRLKLMGPIDELLELDSDELIARRKVCETQMRTAADAHNRAKIEHTRIVSALKAKREGDPDMFGVSDHAVIRYLQRYKGLDVKSIREEIRTLARSKMDERLRDQVIEHNDLRIAVSNGVTVTTIWTNDDGREPQNDQTVAGGGALWGDAS